MPFVLQKSVSNFLPLSLSKHVGNIIYTVPLHVQSKVLDMGLDIIANK